MSLTILAENLLEEGTVTVPGVALTPLARLHDRRIDAPYVPGFETSWAMHQISPLTLAMGAPAVQQIDIDVDLGVARAVSAWALLNHNLTGITVSLFGKASFPPDTLQDSVPVSGADVYREITTTGLRYWRIRIPAMAVPPQIGELLLGVPHVVQLGPTRNASGRATVGNVARDYTPAKLPRTAKLGAPRARLDYAWNAIETADGAVLEAAYAACDEGAKSVLVRDPFGVVRWMQMAVEELGGEYVSGRAVSKRLTLEEVPR